MFAGHYFGASNGSRGGERGLINRQLFSSLEQAVGLFLPAASKTPVEPSL